MRSRKLGRHLRCGDFLDRFEVTSGTWLADRRTVHNLEVAGHHTYFVGEAGVWVHNTCNVRRNVGGGELHEDEVLDRAEDWLGSNYREIDDGVFRSADGCRQFRMMDGDLSEGHVHFESVGPDGREIQQNAHIDLVGD